MRAEVRMSVEYDGRWKRPLHEGIDLALKLFFPDVYAAIDWTRDVTSLDGELPKLMPEPAPRLGVASALMRPPVPDASAASTPPVPVVAEPPRAAPWA